MFSLAKANKGIFANCPKEHLETQDDTEFLNH